MSCQLSLSSFQIPSLKREIVNDLYKVLPDVLCITIIIELIMNTIEMETRDYYVKLWGGWKCSGNLNIKWITDYNHEILSYKNKRKGWGWKLPTIPQKLLRDIQLLSNDFYSYIPIKKRLSIVNKQIYKIDLDYYNPYYLSSERDELYSNIIKDLIKLTGINNPYDIDIIHNSILSSGVMKKWFTYNYINQYIDKCTSIYWGIATDDY